MPMVYLKLFYDQVDALDAYSDEEVGRLIRGAVCYARDGKQPVFTGNERFVWPLLKNSIDRSNAEYDTLCKNRQECGKKGGRPKKPKGFSENQKVLEESKGFSENQKNLREDQEEEQEEDHYYQEKNIDSGGAGDYVKRYLSGVNSSELEHYLEGFPDDVVCHAADEACANGKPIWSYARSILNRYEQQNILTLDEAKASDGMTKEKTKRSAEIGYKLKWVGDDY